MRRAVYPIIVFVLLQLIAYAAITLWIVWYVMAKNSFDNVIDMASTAYNTSDVSTIGWAIMVLGIITLVVMLIGSTYLFIGWMKARQLFKQRSDHISAFTHEMMTPLTCIQMNLEALLLKDDMEKGMKETLLNTAFRESKKLQRSIDKAVEIKRIDHKKHILDLKEINLHKFLENFLMESKEEYPSITMDLKSSLDEDESFLIDRQYLRCVFDNLLENAVNHSGESPKIKIYAQKHKKKLFLRFKDSGKGIDKKMQKQIFKMFYRENKNKRGSGLGLYVVKNMLEWHKGSIKAISEGKGKGTEFEIVLPLKRAKQEHGHDAKNIDC